MQVTDASGYIFGPKGLQVNGADGKPKVITSGGGGNLLKGTASGVDTYTTTISGVTSYNDGDAYLIRFTTGNTTGATLNINSLGAIPLYRNNDGQIIGGDIEDGAEMICVYNSTLSVFQVIGTSPNTLLAYVTNAESVTITKGQPVYAFGGQGDRLKVKLAYNSTDATSAQTVGLVLSASIGANQKGFIILNGQLDGLSILPTSTWADGDPVYLGATAGTITKVKPSAPNHLVYLGFVTTANNGSAGRMYVRVQNGYEMDELHDVQISGLADNDIIQYDLATDLWQNKSLSNAGIQPTLSLTTTGSSGPATLTGSTLNIPQYGGGLTVGTTPITSGTVGRILFEGTGNVLQQSANLFWDNTNGRLGIGTATPSATLHSVGSITASAAIARGNYMQPTLVASANNDVLVGLAINPTFTLSGKTGVTQRYANFGSEFFFNANDGTNPPTLNITSNTFGSKILLNYGSLTAAGGRLAIATLGAQDFTLGTNNAERVRIAATTGNFLINTTTDAGYKLDVNGSTRVQGDITIGSGNGFLRGTVNVVSLFSATDQVTVFSSNRGALSGTLGYFGVTELKPSGGIAQSSIGIGQTNAFVAISQGNVSNTSTESFVVNRGFFGNVVATTKNILNVSSTLNSNLTNATLLRGIYIDINNTTTFTGFTDFRAIESIRGGAYFNTSSVNASAILQADSTTKGFLPPRMTNAQMLAIATPAAGLIVYDTTNNKHVGYDGTAWQNFY